MEPPDKPDKCLAILVLRTVGSREAPGITKKMVASQESVASILSHAKQKVVDTEHWFRDLPYEEAAVVCEDAAIQSIAAGFLGDLEDITTELKKKARQITSKDILRNFRHDYIQKNKDSISSPLLQKHWDKLAEAADGLARNIRLVTDKGGYIFGDVMSGYIFTSGVFDSKEQTPLNRIHKTTAKYLLPHIYTEFPEFEIITDWRRLSASEIKQKISRDMLNNLNLLSQRKSFLGTCKICESWK